MVQIIHQTHEEKVAMYMKYKKKDLAEMLTNCNEIMVSQQGIWYDADIIYEGIADPVNFSTNSGNS